MIRGQPSKTALSTALLRAAHQLVDRAAGRAAGPDAAAGNGALLFEDPLALRIIGDDAAAELRADRDRRTGEASTRLRRYIALRSRIADDIIVAAHARGARTCIILGAGLDTFAYRNPAAELRVIELDHPATQAWKRARLAAAAIAIPATATLAPIDFACDDLGAVLAALGVTAATGPVVVSWLGVTMYLEREATAATLARLGALAHGSELVLDVSPPDARDPALAERVARAGEPFRATYTADEIASALAAAGFAVREMIADRIVHAALTA